MRSLIQKAANGKVQSVEMIYPRSAVHQYLYYGSMDGEDVKVPPADAIAAAQAH